MVLLFLLTAVWSNPCQASLKDGGLQKCSSKKTVLEHLRSQGFKEATKIDQTLI